MKTLRITLWAVLSLTFSALAYGQIPPIDADEPQVRAYTLPLPLDSRSTIERGKVYPDVLDSMVVDAFRQSEIMDKKMNKKMDKRLRKALKKASMSKILRQSKGSITFVVDEGLPAPKKSFAMKEGRKVAGDIVGKSVPSEALHQVVKSSFDDETLCYMGEDNLFKCMVNAYADHHPLVLSPDVVWLIIAQGFSGYVNAHSEEMRDLFVEHDGKMRLVVAENNDVLGMSGKQGDWEKLLSDFTASVAANTKGDVVEMMTADFTTTGVTERIASQITLMDAVETFFEWWNMAAACGIPSITLTGTPDDWRKVQAKARGLSKYGLVKWSRQLDKVLAEFVRASEGQPDRLFWRSIVKKLRVDELKNFRGCGDNTDITLLDGWFLTFFPDKRTGIPQKEVAWTSSMANEMVSVPFNHVYTNPVTNEDEEVVPMELWAGFVGVEVDSVTQAFTPKIGWLARVADAEAEEVARMEEKNKHSMVFYYSLSKDEPTPPEILSKMSNIHHLDLYYKDEIPVNVPEWMDSLSIGRLSIDGSLTDEEEARLRQRFPNAFIKNRKKK